MYTWINSTGEVDHRYLKHKPVPGEPSIPGIYPLFVRNTQFARLSGAICYDFDFPAVALPYGQKNINIVVVPSSDNPGVDPQHTQIAAVRAIEGGYSILRPTRLGRSAGIDPYGRQRGWISANETDQKMLLVTLPTKRIQTLYALIGDALVYCSILYLTFIFYSVFIRVKS